MHPKLVCNVATTKYDIVLENLAMIVMFNFLYPNSNNMRFLLMLMQAQDNTQIHRLAHYCGVGHTA